MTSWTPSSPSVPPLVLVTTGSATHLAVQFADWTLCGVPLGPEPSTGSIPTCRHCAGRLPEEA